MKKLSLLIFLAASLTCFSQHRAKIPLVSKYVTSGGGGGGGGGGTPVVTAQNIGTLRNNYSDFVGFAFYVGASNITVTSLGRWITSGNTGSHTIKIIDYATGATVVSASLNTSGITAGAYGYVACTPTVLSATVRYAILSLEVNGGDFWGDEASITVTSAINTVRSAYLSGSNLASSTIQDVSYVPLNFKY